MSRRHRPQRARSSTTQPTRTPNHRPPSLLHATQRHSPPPSPRRTTHNLPNSPTTQPTPHRRHLPRRPTSPTTHPPRLPHFNSTDSHLRQTGPRRSTRPRSTNRRPSHRHRNHKRPPTAPSRPIHPPLLTNHFTPRPVPTDSRHTPKANTAARTIPLVRHHLPARQLASHPNPNLRLAIRRHPLRLRAQKQQRTSTLQRMPLIQPPLLPHRRPRPNQAPMAQLNLVTRHLGCHINTHMAHGGMPRSRSAPLPIAPTRSKHHTNRKLPRSPHQNSSTTATVGIARRSQHNSRLLPHAATAPISTSHIPPPQF